MLCVPGSVLGVEDGLLVVRAPLMGAEADDDGSASHDAHLLLEVVDPRGEVRGSVQDNRVGIGARKIDRACGEPARHLASGR